MTKQDFILCMKILNAYYLDWQFNFNDKTQVETWYQYLQGMGFAKLKSVINYYMSKNDKGPNSPRGLLRARYEYELKSKIHGNSEANNV